ncbi:Ornithine decarboxylase [Dimargaris verticillata]|uniref:ornithine decarboxylase n=1 Tax=Dimargaris verticillata TaxID=2761393 RepID=A0A9W8B4P7_9FUNG|nr:Ornithine decarboxylase [Dimargaris verticillata]
MPSATPDTAGLAGSLAISAKSAAYSPAPSLHRDSHLTTSSKRETVAFCSVSELMRTHIADHGAEDAFFVADLGEVYRQYLRWQAHLPRVEPFYAVKCNPDPRVLRLLAKLGLGFDCASRAELQAILELGVTPDRIVYANPCKQASHLRFAATHQVGLLTFDNADELHKIRRLHPHAQLLLRILTDDSKSLCQLGIKFGAPLHTTASLLQLAHDLGLNVVGVSFHVGSGCLDPSPFADAVQRAHRVFAQGAELGFDMHLLDVGGGFPSALISNGATFERTAAVLGPALDQYFPASSRVRFIAEPGRYFVSSAFTLAVGIIARRVVVRDQEESLTPTEPFAFEDALPEGPTSVVNHHDQLPPTPNDHPAYMYYVNDGVYGSFNCLMFDHATVHPRVLASGGVFRTRQEDNGRATSSTPLSDASALLYDSSLWGPTCDSIDCIAAACRLPQLDVGDWLYFPDMGAYTVCAASQFNGFQTSPVVYTDANNSIPYALLL